MLGGLAEALATGDASKFSPGKSNLDFRKWLRFDDGKAKPFHGGGVARSA